MTSLTAIHTTEFELHSGCNLGGVHQPAWGEQGVLHPLSWGVQEERTTQLGVQVGVHPQCKGMLHLQASPAWGMQLGLQ